MGSLVVGSRTGILFNNEMGDFSLPEKNSSWTVPPAPANYIEPGKRPLSSMCPVILTSPDGVAMAIGGAGGTSILTGVSLVRCNMLKG